MTIEALYTGIRNCKLGQPNALPVPLLDGLRSDSCNVQWNATLLQIRDAKSYATLYPEYKLIEEWWTQFGVELGFNEGAAESQRDKTRFCASPPCPFYSKSSPEPLRVCTGCKQVYYCSQTCQKMCAFSELCVRSSILIKPLPVTGKRGTVPSAASWQKNHSHNERRCDSGIL